MTVIVAGTFDTKGAELRFMIDILKARGVAVRAVDLSTTGGSSEVDVSPEDIAAHHSGGAKAVFTGDRGTAVAAMTEAYEAWMRAQTCLLYTSPSPRDATLSRMPSSA